MNTPIEQAFSRWKQSDIPFARQLRGEQVTPNDYAKDLNYQLEAAMKDPTAFLGTIKAVGNLNLVPRIARETLRGPETQTLQSFMNQVKQTPGITKEGLKSAAAKLQYITPEAKMTKAEFEKEINPSKYQKVDLATRSDDIREHFRDTVENEMDDYDVYRKMGLSEELRDHASDIMHGGGEMHNLPKDIQKKFKKLGYYDVTSLEDAFMMQKEEMIDDGIAYLMEMEGHDPDAMNIGEPSYKYIGQQRLTPKEVPNKYFELGVSHPEQKEAYRHYNDPDTPPGLIGHVRGSHITEPTPLVTGSRNQVWTNPGESVIEEIQSDAQKIADQTGHLHQVHGTLTKAAIQDALEKGSHTVYVPTSRAIGSVRGTPGGEYSSIYDDAIIKEALGPLQQVPGVKITPPKETPYSYPWTRDTTTDAYNLLGIPHKQHESAKIFLSAPTGGKERLMNRSQNLLNQLDADQTTLEVLGNMENRPWYMDDTVQAVKDKQANYNAHQDFIKWVDEKFPAQEYYFTPEEQLSNAIKDVAAKREAEIAAMKNNPDEMPYHKIEFSPEAIEHILKGPGQTAPGYKAGGSVDMDKIHYALAMRKGGEAEDTKNEKTSFVDPSSRLSVAFDEWLKGDSPAARIMRGESDKIIEDLKKPATPMTDKDMMDLAVNFGPLAVGSIGTKVTPSVIAKVRERLLAEKQGGDQLVRRLERAADEVPNLEKQFDERGLFELFGRTNAGWEGNRPNLLKVIHPSEFSSKYAAELPTLGQKQVFSRDPSLNRVEYSIEDPKLLSNAKYVDYLANDVLKNQGGFDRVPKLNLNYRNPETHKLQPRGTPQLYISGHEGRHRTAALDKAGYDKTIVEFDPGRDLRDLLIDKVKSEPPVYRDAYSDNEGYRGFYDQDRFLKNFKKLFGESPKISPEVERDPVFFKDFFAQGGPVHMAGGGQPNNKFSYSSKLADLAGLDEEYRNANTIPLEHYPKSTEHNGPADAMRHMLFQAQLTKNYNPTLAKVLSQGHERLLDWGQPDAEQAMDFHNDAIGREIGTKAKSIDEMTQMAKDAIASGRAKTINRELPGKYYKLGGKVKNVSTNTGNHGNIALTTAQMRANLMRKKHG
jgi:hypothetical protein